MATEPQRAKGPRKKLRKALAKRAARRAAAAPLIGRKGFTRVPGSMKT